MFQAIPFAEQNIFENVPLNHVICLIKVIFCNEGFCFILTPSNKLQDEIQKESGFAETWMEIR